MRRRDFVRNGMAGALGAALPWAHAQPAIAAPPPPSIGNVPVQGAKNVIFFAYDGFSHEDLGVARAFAQRHLGRGPLAIERLLSAGASGIAITQSQNSIVTDSAAGSSAWSTGRRVPNGRLSVDSEDRDLVTILRLAREAGRATGVITSTRLTHATPAGWIATIDDREREEEIALQYLDFAPDLLLGGGSRHFDARFRSDNVDLFGRFAEKGYSVCRTLDELNATNASRVLGAFTHDHLPFEIDRQFQSAQGPSLAELTRRGLALLSDRDGGFVVQIEAGRVDHANHNNDPGAMVWDVLAADEALALAMEFADRDGNTLLIVSSDHTTGGGALYGVGRNYSGTNNAFEGLGQRRGSQELLLSRLGRDASAAEFREVAESILGIALTTDEAVHMAHVITSREVVAHATAHGNEPLLSLGFLATGRGANGRSRLNYNYATGAHTSAPVIAAAYGAGVTPTPLGIVDNTDLFYWMLGALGVSFENPVSELASTLLPEPMLASIGR